LRVAAIHKNLAAFSKLAAFAHGAVAQALFYANAVHLFGAAYI
jgi:hypothetical protein